MKRLISYILLIALCMTGCGSKESTQMQETQESAPNTASVATEEPTDTPIPKTAKKTIEECFRGLLFESPEIYQKKLLNPEYDSVRYDNLSDWINKKGQYQPPKGYKICWDMREDSNQDMASQQMPEQLLDEISTEELYCLIMDLPGTWFTFASSTYLDMLSRYYISYNFMTNFIQRDDSAKIVHQYYQKYSKKEKSKYTLNRYDENYRKGYQDTEMELKRQERFQITEGLEWFFMYKEGKKVPEESVLGLGLYGHY